MRVLVTRPEPDASGTAEKLRLMGHEPVILPLSRIVPVTPNPIPSTKGFAGVVITSASAVSHMPVSLHRRVSELPCHVVGQRTADAAITNGLDVRTTATDSENLLQALAQQYAPATPVLFVCGRVRMAGTERGLGRLGFDVTVVEVYDTLQISYATDYISETIGEKPINAILVLSAIAARQVRDLMTQDAVSKYLKDSTIYCISNRVTADFRQLRGVKVSVAPNPSESGILEVLANR